MRPDQCSTSVADFVMPILLAGNDAVARRVQVGKLGAAEKLLSLHAPVDARDLDVRERVHIDCYCPADQATYDCNGCLGRRA